MLETLRSNKMRALHKKAAQTATAASPRIPNAEVAHVVLTVLDLLWPMLDRSKVTPEVTELRRISNLERTKQTRVRNDGAAALNAYDPSTDTDFGV